MEMVAALETGRLMLQRMSLADVQIAASATLLRYLLTDIQCPYGMPMQAPLRGRAFPSEPLPLLR